VEEEIYERTRKTNKDGWLSKRSNLDNHKKDTNTNWCVCNECGYDTIFQDKDEFIIESKEVGK